jgi:hypothetical protein
MAHQQTTFTLVLAFEARTLSNLVAHGAADPFHAHDVAVRALSRWVSCWLEQRGYIEAENVGFTAHQSHGGGAGWDVEPGAVLTFAGLTPELRPLVVELAEALKVRERQEAVVLLERLEKFTLV